MKPQYAKERFERMFSNYAKNWRGSTDESKQHFVDIYDLIIEGYEQMKGITNKAVFTAWDNYVCKKEDYMEEVIVTMKEEDQNIETWSCTHSNYQYDIVYVGVGYEFIKKCKCTFCGHEFSMES